MKSIWGSSLAVTALVLLAFADRSHVAAADTAEGLFKLECWSLVICRSADDFVEVLIALRQRNLDELESLYWRVADPNSSVYAKYLTIDEIAGTALTLILLRFYFSERLKTKKINTAEILLE